MLTTSKVTEFQNEFDALMNELCKKHNLRRGKSKISYNDSTFKLNIEFGDLDEIGQDIDPKHFLNTQRAGIKISEIGKEIMIRNKIYIFAGLATYAKAVVKCKTDNKNYCVPLETIKHQLEFNYL